MDNKKMTLKLKAILRPGSGFARTAIGSMVEVEESRLVKTETGYAIMNPSWDSKFENAVNPPMPKYSAIFEA